MQVTSEDITAVSRLVNELCGIVLDETKGYLIEARLSRLAESAGCANFGELVQKVRSSRDHTLSRQIIEAITTRETLFFRDDTPFEALRNKVLPDLIDIKSSMPFPKRIRVWSAACSTGQEPYSIAMTFHELFDNINAWDLNILGTDISDVAIKQASVGRYGRHETQRGMNPEYLAKYFSEYAGGWRINDDVRSLASFACRNLLEPLDDLGPFDIIFCRNVAIYFDAAVRRNLFHRLAARLTPHGYLFVGSSESLADLGPHFLPQRFCRAVFYQPNQSPEDAVPRSARLLEGTL